MIVKELINTPFIQIVHCFNEAFSDYFIPFQVESGYLKRRWYISGVDYSLSFGAFEGDKMVGFLITGVGEWLGLKTAYIAATGIVPANRGRGIVKYLFETAIPKYRTAGIRQSILEVVDQNKRAIGIYEKTGYRIERKLMCYKGTPIIDREISWAHLEFKTAERPHWELYQTFIEYQPTWDYSRAGIIHFDDDYRILELYDDGALKGYMVVQPVHGIVAQFGIKRELGWFERGLAMFEALRVNTDEIKVNNVDEYSSNTIRLVRHIRLKNFLNQFEMKLIL